MSVIRPDFYDFGIRCSTDYAGERRADERRVSFPRDANSTHGQADVPAVVPHLFTPRISEQDIGFARAGRF